ncbi:MAG: protease modulator HflC [Fimbriimonadaceae bacterium]|nr:protease modulator HflC [Fimbriimonadaceae bacterium]
MKRALIGGGLLLLLSVYAVDVTQVAIVTAFGPTGRVVRRVVEPGLHLKWPWQGRRKFDRRVRLYSPRPSECLTADKKNLLVDWFVCWQIDPRDPALFYRTVRTPLYAELRLEETVRGLLTAALGRTAMEELINLETAGGVKTAALTDAVLAETQQIAATRYGIQVVDVRLRRINLPEANKQSVFDRMRAERDRIARKYRAEGEQEARRIRAEADRQKEEILSAAYRDAERIRGDGDATATRTYTAAHNADPEFYKFTRSLEAYDKVFEKDTTVVLSADSPLFKGLTAGPGGAAR